MPTIAQIEAAPSLTVSQAERLRGLLLASSLFRCAPGLFADLLTRLVARVNKQATITGATNATPIVVTATGHPFAEGEHVFVAGVTGNTAANGGGILGATTANSFALVGSTGNAAYVSGGLAVDMISKSLSALVTALEACGCDSTTRLRGGRDGLDSDPVRDQEYLLMQALGLLYTPGELAPLHACGMAMSLQLTNRAVF